MSLVTRADLLAPSAANAAQTNAQRSLIRMRAMTMPPAGSTPPSEASVTAFEAWINAGTPNDSCAATGGPLDVLSCQVPSGGATVTKRSCLTSGQDTTRALGHPAADLILCDANLSTLTIRETDSNGNILRQSLTPISCEAQVRQGSFHLEFLYVRAMQDLQVGGQTLKGTQLTLTNPAVGSIDSAGNFFFPQSALRFLGQADVGAASELRRVRPTSPLLGNFDLGTGQFRSQVVLSSADGLTSMSLELRGATENRVPRPRIIAPIAPLECVNGGAVVALDGSQSFDPDGTTDLSFLWYDGSTYLGSGPQLSPFLSLGVHTITLVVGDSRGIGYAYATVVVEDTLPPTISGLQKRCLWPPNHKLTRIDSVAAQDQCDPHPNLVFVSGSSSEPDNDLGDGNTTGDFAVTDSFVCARAERSGTREGRTYEFVAIATDASGLTASGALTIDVPHDRGDAKDCELVVPPVAEAACAPPSAQAPRAKVASTISERSSSCAVAPSSLVFALVLLLRRRR